MQFTFLAVVFASLQTASADGGTCYEWEVINVDGNLPTTWWGVNDFGLASGNFCVEADCDPFDVEAAVLNLRTGKITKIPKVLGTPGFTQEGGINNRGQVAGYSFDFTEERGVGYVRNIFGKVDIIPDFADGLRQQGAWDINIFGTVVGFSEQASDRSNTSWTWNKRRGFTVIETELDGFTVEIVEAINSQGTVAGVLSDDQGQQIGFFKQKNGSTTTFGDRGAFVRVGDINERGQITFTVFDEQFLGTPYLYDPSEGVVALDIPTQLGDAWAEGINNRGIIAATADVAEVGVIGRPCDD